MNLYVFYNALLLSLQYNMLQYKKQLQFIKMKLDYLFVYWI